MKNRIVSLLAMFCVLALIGCDNTPEPQVTESDTPSNTETQTDVPSNTETQTDVPSNTDSVFKVYGMGIGLDKLQISEEQANAVKEIWENCEWADDVTETMYDYVFIDGDREVRYSYDVGIFNDVTNMKSCLLTNELRAEINDIIDHLVVLPAVSGQEVAAPADFAIHFETWIDGNQRNVLDTYEGYIQKDLVADGVSKKDYTPSHVELCQLYQFVLALEYRDELDFSKPVTYDNYADEELSLSMNPLVCYYLKFTANGKTIEISGDATAGECTDQSQEALYFIQAIRHIGHFCNNTDVYKSMPKANGGYD